jgi:hypothetical protein
LLDLLPQAPFPIQQALFDLLQFLRARSCHRFLPPRIAARAVSDP